MAAEPDTHDDLMASLRAARPAAPEELTSTTTPAALALRQEILTMQTEMPAIETPVPREPANRRRRALAAAALAAAAALIAVAVVTTDDSGVPAGPSTEQAARPEATTPTDIQLIVARTSDALGRTGRATVEFASGEVGSSGTTHLAFSGDDIEMTIEFEGTDDAPGFTAQNKTVDGRFYLLDGPPAERRWYVDTNETGGRGTEIFSIDPRTLVDVLAPSAGFEVVGTEDVDGAPTTHLRARTPSAAPAFNVGLGTDQDATTVTSLDVWVGADDVVRRVDVTTETEVEVIDRSVAPLIEKGPDGTMTLIAPDGTRTVVRPGEPMPDLPMTTEIRTGSYSVRFADIGAPISITAPADAIPVAGQG